MKIINATCLEVNMDLTEGRGPMKPFAYFSDRRDAEKLNNDPKFYKNHGVQGTPYGDYNIKEVTIIVNDSIEEFWKGADEALKQSALKKLSEAERKVLGL